MLNRLKISNFALIDNLNLHFNKGYSVITGETGAGKSIILKALNLLLGERADHSIIKTKTEKCIIEAEFDISALDLEQSFIDWDLDYDPNTIIRREFTLNGKSRLFINDTPTTLNTLKIFGNQIIKIHTQHETLDLFDKQFQIDTLDAFGQITALANNYKAAYNRYQKHLTTLAKLENTSAEQIKERDYTLFLIEEFEKINFKGIDIDEIIKEAEQIDNWEHIQNQLQTGYRALSDEQSNPGLQLKQAIEALSKINHLSSGYQSLLDRFRSVKIEIDDIESELAGLVNSSDIDMERIEIILGQIQDINSLLHKHHCSNGEELTTVLNELETKINSFESLGEEIEKLKTEIAKEKASLTLLANDITTRRKKHAPELESTVHRVLAELGMPNAEIQLHFDKTEKLTRNGFDILEYQFKTNLGGQFMPISKTASGGELSRLMLSILHTIAAVQQLPTLIFDEIDTGVSGEIASKMAKLFSKMGSHTQLISISHLPQIAGKAEFHYHVFKTVTGESTITEVKQLDSNERVVELAKMMSGEKVSEKAVENAKLLLEL